MTTVRSLAGHVRVELDRIRGSRFLADAWPVADADEARARIDEVRRREPDASHHCWAWRLADGREQASDDGEPRDTAGAPILRHLAGADLTDVVVVVTRWFGGTKLGRGGLVRAYGDATAAAIAAAEVVDRPVLGRVTMVHDYADTGAVEGVLAAHDATVEQESFTDEVRRTVALGVDRVEACRAALIEATSGRIRLSGPDDGVTVP